MFAEVMKQIIELTKDWEIEYRSFSGHVYDTVRVSQITLLDSTTVKVETNLSIEVFNFSKANHSNSSDLNILTMWDTETKCEIVFSNMIPFSAEDVAIYKMLGYTKVWVQINHIVKPIPMDIGNLIIRSSMAKKKGEFTSSIVSVENYTTTHEQRMQSMKLK